MHLGPFEQRIRVSCQLKFLAGEEMIVNALDLGAAPDPALAAKCEE